MMKIELFFTPTCSRCAADRAELEAAARQVDRNVEWRNINVLDELDRAVELGVLSLPAVAIDGKLIFTSLPTAQQLRDVLAFSTQAA